VKRKKTHRGKAIESNALRVLRV